MSCKILFKKILILKLLQTFRYILNLCMYKLYTNIYKIYTNMYTKFVRYFD